MVRLRYAGLSLPYKRSLHDAWDWVVQKGQHLGSFPSHGSTAEVWAWDRFLERLVRRSFDRGVSIQQVVLGILSVQRRKRISGSLLAGAWQAVKGWKAIRPSRPRTPITRHLLEALVLAAFSKGYNSRGATRERWWAAALGFWLGFECLLRPGEVLGLRVRDVVVPEDMLAGPDAGVVLVIQTPKTRRVWRRQVRRECPFPCWKHLKFVPLCNPTACGIPWKLGGDKLLHPSLTCLQSDLLDIEPRAALHCHRCARTTQKPSSIYIYIHTIYI